MLIPKRTVSPPVSGAHGTCPACHTLDSPVWKETLRSRVIYSGNIDGGTEENHEILSVRIVDVPAEIEPSTSRTQM
jgi:hypothetical protein